MWSHPPSFMIGVLQFGHGRMRSPSSSNFVGSSKAAASSIENWSSQRKHITVSYPR